MKAPGLLQVDLFFERTDPDGEIVSQAEFQKLVDRVVTPLFPNGLTLFDASGQSFNSTATFSPEETKVISLFVADTSESGAAIDKIAEAYTQQFSGTEVRHLLPPQTHRDRLLECFRSWRYFWLGILLVKPNEALQYFSLLLDMRWQVGFRFKREIHCLIPCDRFRLPQPVLALNSHRDLVD